MLRSFKYLKSHIILILVIFILIAARSYLNLILPSYMSNLLNDVANPDFTEAQRINSIWYYSGLMMFNTIGAIVLVLISGFLEARVSAAFGKKLRSEIYLKIQQFSNQEMDELTTSSLITRTTNDVSLLQTTVMMLLRMVIMLPFLAIGAILLAYQTSPTLSTVLIFSVIAVFAVVGTVVVIVMPKFKIIQKLIDRLNLVTRENLSGLKVVRAFNTEEQQAQKIKDAADETKRIGIFVNRINSIVWPIMGVVMALTSALIAYFAYRFDLVYPGGLTDADISALIQYAMQTIMSFMMITMVLMMLPRAIISAKRIMEVLDCNPTIKDQTDALLLSDEVSGEISFENVSFSYPNSDEPVLSEISFVAKPNSVTAIIGSTGTGKSTLLNLIPRFYEPTSGIIKIDGIDVKQLKQKSYLEVIGYVPQKANLFKGSILSNIAFGEADISLEEVKWAAQIAQASEFIEELNQQYETEIAQGGTNLSGGQRQRVSIARAIAKKPKIYLFDDSFSALDYQTDQKLRAAIKENISATILIVAQRINTIRNADQIIVLNEGKIVGLGKHDELLKTCEVYQEIASSQLTLEELES